MSVGIAVAWRIRSLSGRMDPGWLNWAASQCPGLFQFRIAAPYLNNVGNPRLQQDRRIIQMALRLSFQPI